MGSFNGTCHLSGMSITKNESVVLVPVCYSYVADTTTQVYSSTSACHISNFPVSAHYNEYGSVEKINSEWIFNFFYNEVNKGLINNAELEDKKHFFGNKYALLKRDNFPSEFARLEFFSDKALFDKLRDKENLHDLQEVKSNHELINLLSENNLFSFSGKTIYRHGCILIKKSFLNNLINKSYQNQIKKIKSNILDHIITPLNDDEMINNRIFHGQAISKDNFENDVVELFNDRSTFSHEQYNALKAVRNHYHLKNYENYDVFKEKMMQLVESMAEQAIISTIYSDLGKTFYPNSMLLKGHKPLYDYASLLKQELETLNRQNLEFYSPENGYDEETQSKYQWRTPNQY